MDNLRRNKIIFWVISLFLFLVCVCGNFYTIDSYAVNTYFTRSESISARLYSGDVIEQQFTLREGDQGVQVVLGTYLTVIEKGTVTAELFDMNGTKLEEASVALEGFTDNKYANFLFGDIEESYHGQKLRVRFTFENIDDQLLAVYDSNVDADKYVYTINGEQKESNLAMNGISETTYAEYRDLRLFYVFGIGVFFSYVVLFKSKQIDMHKHIESVRVLASENVRHMLMMLVFLIGSIIAAVAYTYMTEGGIVNIYRVYARIVFAFILALLVYFKNHILERVHIFFFVICMLVGNVYVVSAPPIAVGWDEQEHYAVTSHMSWGAKARISESDYMIYSKYAEKTYGDVYDREYRTEWIEEINAIDTQGGMRDFNQVVTLGSIAYVIPSIVLYVARTIGVEFVTRFALGRFINLLFYSVFMAMAIKVLKGRGKILVTALGLIPTNILLASSYSYDWWVTSLIVLGFSIFLGELQEKGVVSVKKHLLAVIIMGIGMLPKAVYLPLMIPMMLLKKERYEDVKKSRLIVIFGMVALMVSFVLPFIISIGAGVGAAAGGGDIRGGSDVSATGQIAYIFSNIPEFLNLLKKFLIYYLNPDQAMKYLTEMSAQARGSYHTVCMILVTIASTMDNSKNTALSKKEPIAVVGGYLSSLCAIILVVVALYIAYTPVGHTHINGVQLRYVLPVLFPFLFIAGENALDVTDELKKKVLVWCLVGMSAVAIRAFLYSFIAFY